MSMANAPPIPPLLCCTPPPIDFDEHESAPSPSGIPLDDEEFGDFMMPPIQDDNEPVHSDTSIPTNPGSPATFDNVLETIPNNKETTSEITNYQAQSDSSTTSKGAHECAKEESIEKNQAALTESNGNSLPHTALKTPNEIGGLKNADHNIVNCNFVQLEDIEDDSSDDEFHRNCSTNNMSSNDATEKDFFAIHVLSESQKQNDNSGASSPTNAVPNVSTPVITLAEQYCPTATVNNLNMDEKDKDDINNCLSDDDFQEFHGAETVECVVNKANGQIDESDVVESHANIPADTCNNNDDEDDGNDDEFGDFSEAKAVPESNLQIQNSTNASNSNDSIVILSASNIQQRITPILQLMFPLTSQNANGEETKILDKESCDIAHALLQNSIDSAKALDYQWVNSRMRNALVKSLGIDSRNILYGENWNCSMPRFAANLSCNPLKPLKPQLVCAPEVNAEKHNTMYAQPKDSNNQNADMSSGSGAEWNSSVNIVGAGFIDGVEERPKKTTHHESPKSSTVLGGEPHENDDEFAGFESNSGKAPATSVTKTTGEISDILSGDSISINLDHIPNKLEIVYDNELNANLDPFPPVTKENGGIGLSFNSATEVLTTDSIHFNTDVTIENDRHIDDEVVTTSTFAGPLKETHIYTPSRNSECCTSKSVKISDVDFDYEKAAIGIIIDETVVKKEYRDVVYDPVVFDLDSSKLNKNDYTDTTRVTPLNPTTTIDTMVVDKIIEENKTVSQHVENIEIDEEFTDFQSVSPPSVVGITGTVVSATSNFSTQPITIQSKPESRTSTPTSNVGMILSPAILLPQAISIESKKPQIEWGGSAANINPDELARIEELFSQSFKANRSLENCNSQRSTPSKDDMSLSLSNKSLSISENVAQREQNSGNDDDWTEFISVPLPSKVNVLNDLTANALKSKVNPSQGNSTTSISIGVSLPPHASQQNKSTTGTQVGNANDEEWSDFVSVAPTMPQYHIPQGQASKGVPQFNSGAWQNANFYNNPLGCYQKSFINVPKISQTKMKTSQTINNNNTNISHRPSERPSQPFQQYQSTAHRPQQIHVIHDFSTSPVHSNMNQQMSTQNHFQVGNAKVAPSVSLIPDLGFVAPCVSARTTIVNAIPKATFNVKK